MQCGAAAPARAGRTLAVMDTSAPTAGPAPGDRPLPFPDDLLLAPADGAPELLFLLFHGVGSQAEHLRPLADRLRAEYPRAAVVCVMAPHEFDGPRGDGPARQWFSIRGVTEANRPARVAAALPEFLARVRGWQAHFGLPWPRVALAGFSQGAVMALEAVQAQPELCGRVLSFSGRHAAPPTHAPRDTVVHFLHGLQDLVIPPGPAIDAAQRLVALDGDVTADVLPGIGHELHPQLLDKAVEHLRHFVPKKLWREALSDAPVENRPANSRELGR